MRVLEADAWLLVAVGRKCEVGHATVKRVQLQLQTLSAATHFARGTPAAAWRDAVAQRALAFASCNAHAATALQQVVERLKALGAPHRIMSDLQSQLVRLRARALSPQDASASQPPVQDETPTKLDA